MRLEAVEASELGGRERARWADLQAASGPDHMSAFLSADWALAVDAARRPFGRGVKVLIAEDQGGANAFLPVQITGDAAMPAGAPLCDYQGLVAAPGVQFDARDLLAALGVGRFDFCNMLAGDPAFGIHARGFEPSYVVDLSEGYDAYAAGRKAAGTDVLKDIARKRRKLEREAGLLELRAFSHSRSDFETLLRWKREQLRRTGQTDILSRPWVRLLLERLFESRDPGFGAALFTLHAGDQLAAAQLHVRSEGGLHAWFIVHNPDLERYSPGLIMFGDLLRWMAGSPYRQLDLGPVAYRFKDRLASHTRLVGHGFVGRPCAATVVRAAGYGVRALAERLPLGRVSTWPGKAMRRLDVLRALA